MTTLEEFLSTRYTHDDAPQYAADNDKPSNQTLNVGEMVEYLAHILKVVVVDEDGAAIIEECPCCSAAAELLDTSWGRLCAVCTSEQEGLERDAERQGDWEREEQL